MKKVIKRFLTLSLVISMLFINTVSVLADTYINGDTGEEMTVKQQEATEKFLESTDVTDNFVVYADELSQNGHIDGNICVNELTTKNPNDFVEGIKNSGNGEEHVYNEKGEELGDYSIIINGNDLEIGYINGGEILVADDIEKVDNINDTSQYQKVNLDANKDKLKNEDKIAKEIAKDVIQAMNKNENLTKEEKEAITEQIKEEVKINENLEKIAEAGEEMAQALAPTDPDAALIANYTKFKLLPSFNSDTVVTFTVTPEDLQSQEFANAIDNLLRDNQNVGAKIILNISYNGEESLTIAHPINGNAAYDISTGYLVWNFGEFDGTITYNFTTEGVIVAPNAIVNFNVMDGRIIADTVIQGQGQEIHMPYTTKKQEPPKEDPEPEPEPEDPQPEDPEPTPTPDEPAPEPTPTPVPEQPKPTPPTPRPVTPTPDIPPVIPETPVESTPPAVVTIPDEPVPLSDGSEVLGARRESSEPLELPKVLGVKRTKDKAVLGKRRGPETGDSGMIIIYSCSILLLLCLFIIIYTTLKNKTL